MCYINLWSFNPEFMTKRERVEELNAEKNAVDCSITLWMYYIRNYTFSNKGLLLYEFRGFKDSTGLPLCSDFAVRRENVFRLTPLLVCRYLSDFISLN